MQEINKEEIGSVVTIQWSNLFETIVRLVGAVIMIVGVVVALQVLRHAWDLFNDHASVVAFGEKIEKASNLNNAFNTLLGESLAEFRLHARQVFDPNNANNQQPAARFEPWNLSYFVAWFVKILLLLLIARIGFWAMSEGGKLALVSLGERTLAKNMTRELLQDMALWRSRHDVLEQATNDLFKQLNEKQHGKPNNTANQV